MISDVVRPLLMLALAAALPAQAQQAASSSTTRSPEQAPALPTEAPVVLDKVVVSGIRESLADALGRQKESGNLKSVLSASDIGAMPDKNVADALSRLTGVSIVSGGGEGRLVNIRGVDSGLNLVTMNGETLAASSTTGAGGSGVRFPSRAAPLDVLSTASAAQLEVIKTVTPDMDGNSIGGTINIITPTGFDWNRRTIYGTAELTLNDMVAKGNAYNWNLNFADRFGEGRRWGLYLSANDQTFDYKSNNIQARYLPDTPGVRPEKLSDLAPDRIRLPAITGTRQRGGLTGNLEFRPAENRKLYLRVYHTTDENAYYRAENRIDFTGPFVTQGDFFGTATGNWASLARKGYFEREVTQAVVGGEMPLTENVTLAASATYTKGTEWQPYEYIFDSRGLAGLPVRYELSVPYFPQFSLSNLGANQWPTDKSLWSIFRIQDNRANVYEKARTAKLDLTWRREVLGKPAKVKVGAKALKRRKVNDEESLRYDTRARPRPTWAETPSGATGQLGVDYASYQDFGASLDGRYKYGPTLDLENALAWYQATRPAFPGYVAHQNDVWVFALNPSLSGASEDDYRLEEDIYAGYLMADVDYTPNLKFIGGVRWERTETSVNSDTYAQRGSTVVLEPIVGATEYDSVLPNVQFRYARGANLLFRGGISWTLGRPDYVDASPKSILSYDDANGNGLFEGSLDIGNPDLKPYESINYDLSADYYLPFSGVISVGIFYKDITNAVYTYQDVQRNVVFGGRTYETLTRTTKLNAKPGHTAGVEFTYQQNFTFLPSPFDGFGVAANYMIGDSEVLPLTRTAPVTFFGQSDTVRNLQLYYQKYGFEARLGYHFQDDFITTVGPTIDEDDYFEKRDTYDFKASYRTPNHWKFYVEVRNITNEPIRIYRGQPNIVAFNGPANEYMGVNYVAGVGWNF
ncbi:MAG: TonB-dependent receptor [Opitutaceae bacterium]|nr:TonB-dependent receptor [Opitutaceae bacterium]